MKIFHLERAEPLALLRIVVPILVVLSPGLREGVRVAGWDPALRVVPEGLGFFAAHVPIRPDLARAIEALTVFSALCASIGVRARPALVALTIGAAYLFSIAQLTGFVWHDMHLLWMCALLAASPCDHALAWDRLPSRPPSLAYGVPLAFARALLGAVYFFPGFHKLREQGLGWALSDNLCHQLWWKWAEHGTVPFRIDHHPFLLHAGGLFVLAFELSAPLLFFVRRTRALGAVAGVAFHVLAQAIFLIPFAALWACYVVLLDVRVAFPSRPAPEGETPIEPSRWPLAIGTLLLAGAVIQGARGQTQSYPFACYPTFQFDPGPTIPDLRFVATTKDGRTIDVPVLRDAGGKRTQRQWGTVFALAGVTHPVSDARLRAAWRALPSTPPDAVRVEAYRVRVAADPDERGREVARESIDVFTP